MNKLLDPYMTFNPATMRFTPHEHRRYVLPFHLYFSNADLFNNALTLPATPANAAPVVWKQPFTSANGMDMGMGQPLEVKYLALADSTDGYSGAEYTVQLQEIGETRLFMNQPVHARTVFGTAMYPAKLLEPIMLWSQHQVQANFAKLVSGTSDIRAYLAGIEYYPWATQTAEQRAKIVEVLRVRKARYPYVWPFWLTTSQTVSLSGDASADFDLAPGEDAHFQAHSIVAVSTGNFSWELSEVKTNATLSNGAATQTNSLATDARLVVPLKAPYLVPAGYRLRLTLTDLSGSTNAIYFTIQGRKIYAPLKNVPVVLCDTEARAG